MSTTSLASVLLWPSRAVRALLIAAIWIYQVTLSPLLGPACRFEPSCSRYTVEALKKYGLLKGLGKGFRRSVTLPPLEPRRVRSSMSSGLPRNCPACGMIMGLAVIVCWGGQIGTERNRIRTACPSTIG